MLEGWNLFGRIWGCPRQGREQGWRQTGGDMVALTSTEVLTLSVSITTAITLLKLTPPKQQAYIRGDPWAAVEAFPRVGEQKITYPGENFFTAAIACTSLVQLHWQWGIWVGLSC